MKILISKSELSQLKYNQPVPLECENCHNTFYIRAAVVRFYLAKRPGRGLRFCSHICHNKNQRRTSSSLSCLECCHAFNAKDKEQRFCSRRCAAIFNNRKRKPKTITVECFMCKNKFDLLPYKYRQKKNQDRVFCTKKCFSLYRSAKSCLPIKSDTTKNQTPKHIKINFSCAHCQVPVYRSPSQINKSKHKLFFCSKSCRMKYWNLKHHFYCGINKSKPEILLVKLIKDSFPDMEIQENIRTIIPNGLELDIYLPSKQLAIELNGPTHFFPIFGSDRLLKILPWD